MGCTMTAAFCQFDTGNCPTHSDQCGICTGIKGQDSPIALGMCSTELSGSHPGPHCGPTTRLTYLLAVKVQRQWLLHTESKTAGN